MLPTLPAHLSKQSDVEHIILMNAYYISPYETMLPDPNMVMLREEEIEESAADRIKQLEKLKKKLQVQVKPGVTIHTKLRRSHLLRAVVDTIAEEHADLVILGSIGNSTVRENNIGIGSHVISSIKGKPGTCACGAAGLSLTN
jgi:nucleotide-binding universal stress UspA family protein